MAFFRTRFPVRLPPLRKGLQRLDLRSGLPFGGRVPFRGLAEAEKAVFLKAQRILKGRLFLLGPPLRVLEKLPSRLVQVPLPVSGDEQLDGKAVAQRGQHER